MALLKEGHQRRQKIQIDAVNMRWKHTGDAKHSFHK
jgi:hypothetical protein